MEWYSSAFTSSSFPRVMHQCLWILSGPIVPSGLVCNTTKFITVVCVHCTKWTGMQYHQVHYSSMFTVPSGLVCNTTKFITVVCSLYQVDCPGNTTKFITVVCSLYQVDCPGNTTKFITVVCVHCTKWTGMQYHQVHYSSMCSLYQVDWYAIPPSSLQ